MFNDMNRQFMESIFVCNSITILLWWVAEGILRRFGRQIPGPSDPNQRKMMLPFLLYIVSIAAITIMPLPFSSKSTQFHNEINYLPLVNTFADFGSQFTNPHQKLLWDRVENVIGNLVMFIPLGFMLPLLHKRFAVIHRVLFAAFLFSLSIESMQLLSRYFNNYRQVDVDDIVLNTLGAAAGFMLYKIKLKDRPPSSGVPQPS